jgi:hypothetical protein
MTRVRCGSSDAGMLRENSVSRRQVLKFERAGLVRRVKIPGLRAGRYDADESAALVPSRPCGCSRAAECR